MSSIIEVGASPALVRLGSPEGTDIPPGATMTLSSCPMIRAFHPQRVRNTRDGTLYRCILVEDFKVGPYSQFALNSMLRWRPPPVLFWSFEDWSLDLMTCQRGECVCITLTNPTEDIARVAIDVEGMMANES